MAKPRVPAETQLLAYWFVKTFLKDEKFDYRKHGRHLKDAKRLVNPDDKELKPYDPEAVKGCLLALRAGLFGFDGAIESMWCVTFAGEAGTYYEEYIQWASRPPASYRLWEVKLWEICTGKSVLRDNHVIIDVPIISDLP